MALIKPRPLEPAWEHALARAAKRPTDVKALAVMVGRLSRRYNGEEADLARSDELLARALFWFPRDVRKIALAAAELSRAGALPPRPLRVLDVGAGMGATSLGLVRALAVEAGAPRIAHVTAMDTDAEALVLLRRIADEAARDGLLPAPLPEIETRVADLVDPAVFAGPGGVPYDLVLVGNALVEATRALGDETARGAAIADHASRLIERAPLAPDGALVIIEPATRPETRALHHARARLLERGLGIFAPCTHHESCPMLDRDRDWCHEDLDANLPAWLVPVAKSAGLRWEGLTFSYLVVRRDRAHSVGALVVGEGSAAGSMPVRLVSTPRGTKGKVEAFASGPFEGPTRGPRLMQLEREAKRAPKGTDLLEDCERGDVLGLTPDAAHRAWEGKPVRVSPGELVRVKK